MLEVCSVIAASLVGAVVSAIAVPHCAVVLCCLYSKGIGVYHLLVVSLLAFDTAFEIDLSHIVGLVTTIVILVVVAQFVLIFAIIA
jgi:hypothetical protein